MFVIQKSSAGHALALNVVLSPQMYAISLKDTKKRLCIPKEM
jgi:hypothetical protein